MAARYLKNEQYVDYKVGTGDVQSQQLLGPAYLNGVMKRDIESIETMVRKCRGCGLWKSRSRAVPGEGPGNAALMFVGEAPGRKEDESGRPFVGRSGELLSQVLESSGLDRSKVYITSVLKCRPPDNRQPRADEMRSCTKLWLFPQIELIDPDVVVVLGRVAMKCLLGKGKLKDHHGKLVEKEGRNYFVTYHPAAGIRFPELKDRLKEDIDKLVNMIKR